MNLQKVKRKYLWRERERKKTIQFYSHCLSLIKAQDFISRFQKNILNKENQSRSGKSLWTFIILWWLMMMLSEWDVWRCAIVLLTVWFQFDSFTLWRETEVCMKHKRSSWALKPVVSFLNQYTRFNNVSEILFSKG